MKGLKEDKKEEQTCIKSISNLRLSVGRPFPSGGRRTQIMQRNLSESEVSK